MDEGYRPTLARVKLEAIVANYCTLKRYAGDAQVCAVVKADAYGHGVGPVSRALAGAGCSSFAVSSLEEALELREEGVEGQILLLFGAPPGEVELLARLGLVPMVGSVEQLEAMVRHCAATGTRLGVDLNVETGMGRGGIAPDELDRVTRLVADCDTTGLCIEGVATHFARAAESEAFTTLQMERFDSIRGQLAHAGIKPERVHAANSAACMTQPRAAYDLVRAGIALYGAAPEPGMVGAKELVPAMEWVTAIESLRQVAPGTPLGYGGSFVTQRASRIASLPVGYADGYNRRLGGCGQVLVGGQRAPVVGRVCMDVTLVDVTDVSTVAQGDEVVLLGCQGNERISAECMAGWLETISYEILCGVSKRVPRCYPTGDEA